MTIDLESLKLELIDNIQNLSDATPEDILLISTAVSNATEDRMVFVDTVDDLPDLSETQLPSGNIVYVSAIGNLVISCGLKWVKFNGEVVRDDTVLFISMAWGDNSFGGLGDNTTTSRSSPVSVVGGITNWSQVSGGYSHSLGVTEDGIVYGWGLNSNGRLGDNTTTDRSSPVSVVGGITNWSQVSGGGFHSLGLTEDGIVYAWGDNGFGRLGDNTTTSRSSPVSVVGGITNWSQVSGGGSHSLGVTEDGIAYAWGSNSYGRLGDNTTTDRSSPVSVVGGITNWSQVSSGVAHSLGVTEDGIVYAWGRNNIAQLGDNTTTDRSSPVSVVGGITNWSQVSCGGAHSLGVTEDGIVYAWGNNANGRLGDNTTTARSSPVSVVGGITNWSQLNAGRFHSLGVTEDGIAYAWGFNGFGRLGDNTTTDRSSPVSVVGGITNWSQVSGGRYHSLGLFVEE